MIARPRIRQLGLGELLDETFRLYRSNFLTFVAIAALVYVPYFIVNYVVQIPFLEEMTALNQQLATPNAANQVGPNFFTDFFSTLLFYMLGSIALSMLYVIFFMPLMEGALARAISQRYLDRPVTVGDSFGVALRRILALIGARLIPALFWLTFFGILIGMFAGIGYIATGLLNNDSSSEVGASVGAMFAVVFGGFGLILVLGVAALIIGIRVWFTSQAAVVEGRGPWESVVRSWRLTQGYFWRTLGYIIVVGVLVALLAQIPAAVITAPLSAMLEDQPRLYYLISSIIGTIFTVLSTPFSLIAYTLMYYDLRIRKEGFDLEQQASAMLSSSHPSPMINVR